MASELFSRLLPRIYQIVEEINRRFVERIRQTYPGDENKVKSMAIIYDGTGEDGPSGHCGKLFRQRRGKLHTEILKTKVLKDFCELDPWKFNNKTNGITREDSFCTATSCWPTG